MLHYSRNVPLINPTEIKIKVKCMLSAAKFIKCNLVISNLFSMIYSFRYFTAKMKTCVLKMSLQCTCGILIFTCLYCWTKWTYKEMMYFPHLYRNVGRNRLLDSFSMEAFNFTRSVVHDTVQPLIFFFSLNKFLLTFCFMLK